MMMPDKFSSDRVGIEVNRGPTQVVVFVIDKNNGKKTRSLFETPLFCPHTWLSD